LKASGRFWDNDSLAMLLAKQLQADLLVCLTDVEGLFDAAPDLPDSKLIPTYSPAVHDKIIKFGAKSTMGRGGMSSKVESAWAAAQAGVTTLIVNGKGFRPALVEAVSGGLVGTLFDMDAAERVRKETARVVSRSTTEEKLLRNMAAEEEKKETMTVPADDFAAAKNPDQAPTPEHLTAQTEAITLAA
jgi:delta-1-pyrroline-5-carboxylate synthetase